MHWSDGLGGGGGREHLTNIVGTGGGPLANKNCPHGRAFHRVFSGPLPGRGKGWGEGLLATRIDSHINLIGKTRSVTSLAFDTVLVFTNFHSFGMGIKKHGVKNSAKQRQLRGRKVAE